MDIISHTIRVETRGRGRSETSRGHRGRTRSAADGLGSWVGAEWSGDAAAEAGGLQPAESEGAYGTRPSRRLVRELTVSNSTWRYYPEAGAPIAHWQKSLWETLNPVLFLLLFSLCLTTPANWTDH